MPRNDGIRYGSGGTIMEILEPTPVKKKETKASKEIKTEAKQKKEKAQSLNMSLQMEKKRDLAGKNQM